MSACFIESVTPNPAHWLILRVSTGFDDNILSHTSLSAPWCQLRINRVKRSGWLCKNEFSHYPYLRARFHPPEYFHLMTPVARCSVSHLHLNRRMSTPMITDCGLSVVSFHMPSVLPEIGDAKQSTRKATHLNTFHDFLRRGEEVPTIHLQDFRNRRVQF